MIYDILSKGEKFYDQETKRELKKKLILLVATSARHAKFLMCDGLGDISMSMNTNERNSLVLMEQFMSTEDDVIIDL